MKRITNDLAVQALFPYWKRACARAGTATADAVLAAWFSRVQAAMQIPRGDEPAGVMMRAYHNVNHVWELCELYDKELRPVYSQSASGVVPDDDVIFLAAFFHDLVYDSTKGDNEERSAAAFVEFAQAATLPADVSDAVRRITLATKKHLEWKQEHVAALFAAADSAAAAEQQKRRIAQEVLNTQVFLDIDLAILGADAERYAEYSAEIRQEWRHIRDEDFCKGRLGFLAGMQARDAVDLFHTDAVKRLRAPRVAANIAWEVGMLKAKQEELLAKNKDVAE
jgi:predicted metal-dependent HD superfamily phosphohydrolase